MVLIMRMFGILILVASLILNCGRCDSLCTDFGKVGPNCYIKNIALNEKSRHDSNIDIPKYSDLANDGDLSTCSYTSDKNTAAPWWNLWLPKYTLFKKLEFVTLDSHLDNFQGFEVHVFNTSFDNFKHKGSMTGKTICYKHNNTRPENKKIEVTCDEFHTGNLIQLQLSTPRFQLVLCDFRIYEECENGKWGWLCDQICGNCDDITCDRLTGTCRQCEPGFKSSMCTEECADGSYGSKCAGLCSKRCGVCDKKTGMCSNCTTGWKGDRCTKECNNGTFGKDCQNKCNSNCLRSGVNEICNNVDGTCLNGCKGGYQGPHCNIKCKDGKWGINCTNECGKCLTSPCNHVNGYCQDGCAAGYKKTWDCHTDCDDGKWGISCTNDCGKCLTLPCNHVNGYCQDGCAAGYKKTWDCTAECEDGTYGNSCLSNCSDNCKGICNRINGTCDQCRQFWTGHFCEKVSDRILSDREESTRCQETPKLNIAFICVGILCVILAVYATVITILFKRKATQKGKEETSGSFSGRTHGDSNENKTNKTETVTNEAATEVVTELASVNINAIDDELHQYTDLTPDTKDVEATYETIQLE